MRDAPLTTSVGLAWDHPRLLGCILVTLLALPVLLITAHLEGSGSPTFHVTTAAAANEVRAGAITQITQIAERATTSTVAPTTTAAPVPTDTEPATTSAPTWTAPPTTEAPAWTPPSTTTPPITAPAWTPPPTTVPQPAANPANVESGVASYYDDPNGGCAHKSLPFGTVVHITASNGRTATCVVDDRGPFGAGRILDLDTSIFAQLAPLGQGLVTVTATW